MHVRMKTSNKEAIKSKLIEKLKANHCLWSYNNASIKDIPDDILIELVMLHLDIDEINLLFQTYPYATLKKAWLENLVAQGERYYTLNAFLAWYYFKMKRPHAYVKSMATRYLHKRLSQC